MERRKNGRFNYSERDEEKSQQFSKHENFECPFEWGCRLKYFVDIEINTTINICHFQKTALQIQKIILNWMFVCFSLPRENHIT